MLSIDEISKIGLGTYRMSSTIPEHVKVIKYTLNNGCNLIDTSNNYMNGKAEQLIGDYFRAFPNQSSKKFVVTKQGYFQGEIKSRALSNKSLKSLKESVLIINKELSHCIHPEFMDYELLLSLKRLNRSYVDCFMLHNPEFYFNASNITISTEDFYNRIKLAFEFLEEKVVEGKIRFYGISSNTFPLSTSKASTINLKKLLEIAVKVSSDHHFKFIQFPFNFLEQGALDLNYDNQSLLDVAKQNSIITLGNRPLNTKDQNGPVRLASYPEVLISQEDRVNDQKRFDELIKICDKQIANMGDGNTKAVDFPIVSTVLSNYDKIGTLDGINLLYKKLYNDFLEPVFQYELPKQVINLYKYLLERSGLYTRSLFTKKALKIKDQLVKDQQIDANDNRSLPVIACEKYLEKGIDHILVGMRKQQYVDELIGLFHYQIKDKTPIII